MVAISRKVGSGRVRGGAVNFQSVSEQGKMRRIITAIALLYHGPISVKDLAKKLECSDRSASRLLNTIDAAGLSVECDMEFRYFLVKYSSCPLCGTKDKV